MNSNLLANGQTSKNDEDLDLNFSIHENGIQNKPENRKIFLHVPISLKRETILRMLRLYGSITDDCIEIPRNQERFKNKEGYQCMFAEFETAADAEKAHRELNSGKNKSLNIRADFAFSRQPVSLESEIAQINREERAEEKKVQSKISFHPPITVNYDVEVDDVFKRWTEFETKKTSLTCDTLEQINFWNDQSQRSKGNFDEESQCHIYNEEILNIGLSDVCSNCSREALLRCDKSSKFFCSIECSKRQHDDQEPPLGKNQLKFADPINVNEKVVIAGIINEKCLYVRRANIDDCRYLNDVLKHSKGAKPMEAYPDVGDLVIADHLGSILRAKVIALSYEEPYEITVQFVDNGGTARVLIGDLKTMSPECQRLECSVQKVLLKNVKVEAINSNLVAYLKNLQDEKTELQVASIDSTEVVLVDKSTGANVNQMIMELSIVDDATYNDEGFILDDWPTDLIIPQGAHQKLFVVNSKPSSEREVIYCVPESKMKDFLELYRSINFYASNRKSTDKGVPPRPNELCLAFFNGQWHRAVVITAKGDGFPLCMLLDLWNEQTIDYNHIIPMPKAFKLPPLLSEQCQYSADLDFKENEWLKVDEVIHDEGCCVLIKK